MGSILENYQKQLEEDRLNEGNDFEMPSFDDEFDRDELVGNLAEPMLSPAEVAKKVKEFRNDPNDMEVQYRKFHEQYKKMTEEDFNSINTVDKGAVVRQNVNVSVIRVYCPECGREIVSKFPVMFNPYTGERIGRYDCECGFKANLEYAYPRVAYFNEQGEEIKAFNV